MNSPPVQSQLAAVVAQQPYPLVFATISGAHLYGFPSGDSDYDLRGVHTLPVHEVVGLRPQRDTIEVSTDSGGLELDLVTHDVRKFAGLMLKRNGYVLEQLYSPLIVRSTPAHEELKDIGRGCITRHHAHHYLGFVRTQWKLFAQEDPPRIKPLLYVYRVLLTGIHLMRTGDVEANLARLNDVFRLPYISDLIEAKIAGAEASALDAANVAFHRAEYERLTSELERSRDASALPEAPTASERLHEFVVQVRLRGLGGVRS